MAFARLKDLFQQAVARIVDPGSLAVSVAPDDNTDLAVYAKALWIGTGGNVAVVPLGQIDDTAVTFVNCQDGSILPIRCRRLMATATTATNIVAITL